MYWWSISSGVQGLFCYTSNFWLAAYTARHIDWLNPELFAKPTKNHLHSTSRAYLVKSLNDVGWCDVELFCGFLNDFLDTRTLDIQLRPSSRLCRVGLSTCCSEDVNITLWTELKNWRAGWKIGDKEHHQRQQLMQLHVHRHESSTSTVSYSYQSINAAFGRAMRCASRCVVECRVCNWEVAGSNLGLGYFASRSTQPSIPPGSVNEYQI